ncbi:MAG: beta-propeller fold lactonase family protein [Phycisphaerales bacterium]|nr:beta-propeller fold lactonase family protein [Phycisphaerales bacterium]
MARARSAPLLLAAAAASAITSSTPAQPAGKTLFVGHNVGGQVTVHNVGTDGSLTAVPGSPFAAGANNSALAITPDGRTLVAVNATIDTTEELRVFSVTTSGALVEIAPSPYMVGDGPLGLTIDRLGRFVFAPTASPDRIHVFAIDDSGLTQIAGSPFPTPNFPEEVDTTPDGKFLYISHLFGTISAWSIGAGGVISQIQEIPTSNDAFELIVSPDGRNVYVGEGLSHTVGGFSIDPATGELAPIPGGPFPSGGSSAVNLCITPDGRWVFVCNVVSDTLTVMARDPDTGALAFVPGSAKTIGNDIRKCATDGVHVFVTDETTIQQPVGVRVFSIDASTGLLAEIPGSPFPPYSGRPQDLVLWTPPAACAADLNGDGIVDFADYLEFLNLYDALDPRADFNHDGLVDFADYLEFLNRYDAGC